MLSLVLLLAVAAAWARTVVSLYILMLYSIIIIIAVDYNRYGHHTES